MYFSEHLKGVSLLLYQVIKDYTNVLNILGILIASIYY